MTSEAVNVRYMGRERRKNCKFHVNDNNGPNNSNGFSNENKFKASKKYADNNNIKSVKVYN